MSSFTSPLRVEISQTKRQGRCLARVLEPFLYRVGTEGSGDIIRVPAGFETDFASIPRLFWRFEPPLGDAAKAAVVHDYLYSTKSRPREEADAVFYEAMGILGVSGWKKSLMYAAVRVFGGRGYGS